MISASKFPKTTSGMRWVYLLDHLEEQIRRRAYELYEQRGKEDGHHLEDWLQAESELLRQGAKRATA